MSITKVPPDREPFRIHYEEEESSWDKGSGAGSDPFHTVEYRCFVDKFTGLNTVKSIVDIGCGDWRFSRFMNFDGIDYKGFDVVPSVVEQNERNYASRTASFSIMPENIVDIPSADLLLMKDVLQHLPNGVIMDFASIVFPKFKYCLLTNSFTKLDTPKNIDINPGEFRCLDLRAAPYSLDGAYVLEFSSALWERIRTFLISR